MSDILVAGGGIGGLVAALALLQRGASVRVFEQAGELREIGAGVQISPNGSRILDALGLLDEARSAGLQPTGKEIRLWNSGERWPLFDLGGSAESEYGFPYLMLHRADLHTLLARAVMRIAPDAISLGSKVVAVEQDTRSVTVSLSNGTRQSGDVLVGADGVHSIVRDAVGERARASFTGCMAWRGVVSIDRLPAHFRRAVGTNWVGLGRHVVTYPLRRGELVNFVGVVERDDWTVESWTERGSREECAQDFVGWHPDIQILIGAIEEHYKWALLSRPPMQRWSYGRITLLGDACHSMLPFMAQGAVMAMEDGFVLARAIAERQGKPADALADYERVRMARANRCVSAAERNRQVFHNEQLANADAASRYVSDQWNEDVVRSRYDWLFAYDATSCSLDAHEDTKRQQTAHI